MIHLLLYDGDCDLCSGAVRFVLNRDHAALFRFAPLQGPLAATLLPRHGADPGDLGSLLVLTDLGGPGERLHCRGGAVLLVLDSLGGWWRLLGTLLRLVPRPVLDLGYRLVARVRRRIPSASHRGRACPSVARARPRRRAPPRRAP
jgi:predicted DCC family thiol-disulfide oxidoreductase YuxK